MNRKYILVFIVFSVLFSLSIETEAKCRKDAKVKYQAEYGWSKLYTVEVTFMTGYELNTATNTFNYSAYSVYAIIFWAQNEATVIKLNTFLLCGSEVTCDCIENMLLDMQGYDQKGDKWNICISDFCF